MLYIIVLAYAYRMTMLLARFFSDLSFVAHLLVDMILASHKLKAVWFLWIDLYAIGPPERNMGKLERKRDYKSLRGVPSFTALMN